jgi:hypothetical protein
VRWEAASNAAGPPNDRSLTPHPRKLLELGGQYLSADFCAAVTGRAALRERYASNLVFRVKARGDQREQPCHANRSYGADPDADCTSQEQSTQCAHIRLNG